MKKLNEDEIRFSTAVLHFFEPLAIRANSHLEELEAGNFYQIVGGRFILRIWLCKDRNTRRFSATLALNKRRKKPDDINWEIGLGWFAEYNNHPRQSCEIDSIDEWWPAVQEAACAAETFCLPYLLGERNKKDFKKIRRFIKEKIKADPEIQQLLKDRRESKW